MNSPMQTEEEKSGGDGAPPAQQSSQPKTTQPQPLEKLVCYL